MSQPVKSTDPRKAAIVATLKDVSGCRRVTCVMEVKPGVFQANCLWPTEDGSPGVHTVTQADVSLYGTRDEG